MPLPKSKKTPLKLIHGNAIIAMVVFVLLVAGVSVVVYKTNFAKSLVNKSVGDFTQDLGGAFGLPTPSPMPFVEMTIPHLQARKYESKLGDLARVSVNANYTSYLTSYDSDGLTINGLLTIPAGETPAGGHPAIVFIHGYIPPTLYRTQANYVSYVDYLARNGFVVFKIDLRGHDQSEGDPGGAYYSADYVIDTLNAYSALAKYSQINPDKIGLWGHSMAGNVVLRSLVAKKTIPAAVIWAGAVYTYADMQEYGIDDNSYRPPTQVSVVQKRREDLRKIHGAYSPTSEFWKQVVPTNYLTDIQGTALELYHAVDDSVVSIEYSRNLLKLLQAHGITSTVHEYPSGGHNLTGASFTQAMSQTVAFFKAKL